MKYKQLLKGLKNTLRSQSEGDGVKGIIRNCGKYKNVRNYFLYSLAFQERKYYLARFKEFKSYSDDLPIEKVSHSSEYKNKYKCRLNVILGIMQSFECAIQDGVLKREVVSDFFEHKWNALNKNKKSKEDKNYWTTKEEIELINRSLNNAINYLS